MADTKVMTPELAAAFQKMLKDIPPQFVEPQKIPNIQMRH